MQNTYLRERHGKLYAVSVSGSGRKDRKERWTPVSTADTDLIKRVLSGKEQLQSDIIRFPCMAGCGNTIPMTRDQLNDFFVSYKKKYDIVIMPFCCAECRDKMLEKYG